MDIYAIVAALLTAAGAALMALSFLRTRRILSLLEDRPRVQRWQLLQVMVFLFMIGYLIAIPLLATGPAGALPLLVGTIFLGGAIFVGLTITVSLQTIGDLLEKEEALVAARDEAVEASRLKTALLASVTHELRTPMQAILGYMDMLLQGVYGALTPEQDATLKRVQANARRLSSQINNLLAQSAIESGEQVHVTEVPFSPADLLEAVKSTLHPLAQRKQLSLNCRVDEDVPSMLAGDRDKIEDIALNLAGNAVKFTEEGAVDVQILRPDANHWALRVADTGPGIRAESRQIILEPFQRANNLVTQTEEGMGLGLALVSKWTKLMGGELAIESVEGEGSTFTVRFPLNGEGK